MPLSETVGLDRPEGMTDKTNDQLATVVQCEIVKLFHSEIAAKIVPDSTQELLDLIEDEGRAIHELCEIDLALGLVWISYASEWLTLRSVGWDEVNRAINHDDTYDNSDLQIAYGGCRAVWQTTSELGVAVPHLPAMGSLLTLDMPEGQ